MSITLPPINIGTAVIPSTAGLRLVADSDIRARDIEVARVVPEAAARLCEAESLYRNSRETCPWPGDTNPAIQGHKVVTAQRLEQAIRALEVCHAE